MSNCHLFRKMFFLVCLLLLSPNIYSKTFNVSNTSQLRQALLDAALNGQDDTIILAAGIYKTTSDGLGEFRFSDSEAFSLTIEGSGLGEAILDGGGIDSVLILNNTQEAALSVSNLTIRNGYITSEFGRECGGLYTGFDAVYARDVSVLNNEKGGFCVGSTSGPFASSIIIRDSVISNNSNDLYTGSMALHGRFIKVNRTKIIDNTSNYSAVRLESLPAYSATAIITNSVVANNEGIGVRVRYIPSANIVNTTISDNSGTGVDGSAIYVNNIFVNNGEDNAFGGTFYNNYIDYTKLSASAILKDNILPSAGPPDFVDADYRIGVNSVVIDKGLDPNTNTFERLFDAETLPIVKQLLKKDIDGLQRITGAEIDMGAYEYGTDYPPPPAPPPPLLDARGNGKGKEVIKIEKCGKKTKSAKYEIRLKPDGEWWIKSPSGKYSGKYEVVIPGEKLSLSLTKNSKSRFYEYIGKTSKPICNVKGKIISPQIEKFTVNINENYDALKTVLIVKYKVTNGTTKKTGKYKAVINADF